MKKEFIKFLKENKAYKNFVTALKLEKEPYKRIIND